MPIENFVNETLMGIYDTLSESVPSRYKPIVVLAVYTIIIALYSIFTWKFYKFLAKRNILELNLSQYNTTEYPFWNKFLASTFFLLEYVIILPILVVFWFSIFSVFILLLSEIPDLNQIFLISAAILAATRLVAYFSEDLAEEVVGVFPISLLVVLLLEPHFFSATKLITRITEVPALFMSILTYLIFIFGLEVFMRGCATFIELVFSGDEKE